MSVELTPELKASRRGFRGMLKAAKKNGKEARKEAMMAWNDYGGSLQGGAGAEASMTPWKRIMTADKLINAIHQRGGSWSGFVNFFKNAGNKIADVAKTVYNKGIKPAANYIVKKPLSTLSKVAGAASLLPTGASPALKAAATALGAIGSTVGAGDAAPSKGAQFMNGMPCLLK